MIKYPTAEILLTSHTVEFHLLSDTRAGAIPGSESRGAHRNLRMEAARR
jgi:hypothetical protein